MEINNIHYSCIHTEDGFNELVQALGAGLSKNNSYYLPNGKGAGLLKKINLTAGISVVAFNYSLEEELILYKEPCNNGERIFSFTYILTPEALQLEHVNQHEQVPLHGTNPVLFSCNDVPMRFKVASRRFVKALTITASAAWLLKEAEINNAITDDNTSLLTRTDVPIIVQESCTGGEITEVSSIFSALVNDNYNLAIIMAKVQKLIDAFWKKQSAHRNMYLVENKIMHADKVLQAEGILMEYLTRDLPRLSIIAARVGLSESSLRRYFKIMFGKSMYDYYLERKMQMAHTILMDDSLTVNEVADMVGYEKVSNFISVFRKYQGISPGDMKKRSFIIASLSM